MSTTNYKHKISLLEKVLGSGGLLILLIAVLNFYIFKWELLIIFNVPDKYNTIFFVLFLFIFYMFGQYYNIKYKKKLKIEDKWNKLTWKVIKTKEYNLLITWAKRIWVECLDDYWNKHIFTVIYFLSPWHPNPTFWVIKEWDVSYVYTNLDNYNEYYIPQLQFKSDIVLLKLTDEDLDIKKTGIPSFIFHGLGFKHNLKWGFKLFLKALAIVLIIAGIIVIAAYFS